MAILGWTVLLLVFVDELLAMAAAAAWGHHVANAWLAVAMALAAVSRLVSGMAGSAKSQKEILSAGTLAIHQSAVRRAYSRHMGSVGRTTAARALKIMAHACARPQVLVSLMPLCV